MLDEKFNDVAIRQFEASVPGIHEYWVASKHVTMTKSPLVTRCSQNELPAQLHRSDVAGVIFHSLPKFFYPLLANIHADKAVVWLGWGYDYYSLLKDKNESSRILPKTRSIAKKKICHRLKGKAGATLSRLLHPSRYSVDALARVDYFSPVLDLEFEMVKRHVPLSADYIEWNYGTAEDDLSIPNAGFAQGENILAGNSASATNNHLELFEEIKRQIDLGDRKIIVPLSYGDPYYRDEVIKVGQQMFGQAFVPLVEFMPLDKYLSIVRTCAFVVMNHLRQQALGNICMAMLMGAKVYLNDSNPLAKWLAQRGAVFGSIDRLNTHPLANEEKEMNCRLIYSHFGRDVQIQKTRHLVDLILSKSSP